MGNQTNCKSEFHSFLYLLEVYQKIRPQDKLTRSRFTDRGVIRVGFGCNDKPAAAGRFPRPPAAGHRPLAAGDHLGG